MYKEEISRPTLRPSPNHKVKNTRTHERLLFAWKAKNGDTWWSDRDDQTARVHENTFTRIFRDPKLITNRETILCNGFLMVAVSTGFRAKRSQANLR